MTEPEKKKPSKIATGLLVLGLMLLSGILGGVATFYATHPVPQNQRELLLVLAWIPANLGKNWTWIYAQLSGYGYQPVLLEKNQISDATHLVNATHPVFVKESVVQSILVYPSGMTILVEIHSSGTDPNVIQKYLIPLDFSSVHDDNQQDFLICITGADCWIPTINNGVGL